MNDSTSQNRNDASPANLSSAAPAGTSESPDSDTGSQLPGDRKVYSMPLRQERISRGLLWAVFASVVVLQALYLAKIGNGLGRYTDGFSEANLVRATDAYVRDGLTSHHGLPRMLYRYQNHFPGSGMDKDHVGTDGLVVPSFREGFPPHMANPDQWVYTHYPPGPELLSGVTARFIDLKHLWALRLFPLAFGLLATAVFFHALIHAFGANRAALIAAACVVLPMYHTCMPSLQFQGYSLALLLLQLSLLLRVLWGTVGPRGWHWPVFFLFGFLQGWLSFDWVFVVGLLPLPLWLLRRAEGAEMSVRWLVLCVFWLFLGFILAHALHFLQVAAELGGLRAAFDEFGRTASERAGATGAVALPQLLVKYLNLENNQFGYFGSVALGGYYYVREILLLRGVHFGPVMFLALVLALPLLVSGFKGNTGGALARNKGVLWRLRRPGPGNVLPVLGASLLVSVLWLLAMPAHVVGNRHITVRHLFLFYFCLVLILAKSISLGRGARRE